MIPDKIYVGVGTLSSTQPAEEYAFPGWQEKAYSQIRNEQYIRKDALVDYFRQRMEELNSPLNGVFGSTEREHCNERISELLLLGDKLNEM